MSRTEARKLRIFLRIGMIGGAAFCIIIAFLMDILYSDALGGTWRDAIVKDMHSLFSVTLDKGDFIVTVVFLLILAVLGAFGAFMGMIFTFFVYRFFNFLQEKS